MRILWLSHLVPYPPKGGVLQRAYYLLREVAKYHEVDLLAFNQPDLIRPLYPSVEDGLREAHQALSRFCGKVEFFSIPSEQQAGGRYRLALQSLVSKDPYNINWLKSRDYSAKLKEVIAQGAYDLIHFDTISLAPYLPLASGIPTVLDHHNIESHMLLRRAENEPNFLKRWYYHQEGRRLEQVEKRVCPKVDLNITCSAVDSDRLRNIAPGSRVEDVPNGVDTDFFSQDTSITQEMRLIFVGTLSWYPNAEAVKFIANELWPPLKAALPGVHFDIVGANPPTDVTELAKRDDHFVVHGFVDDVRPLLNRAAVFVCPIRDGGGTKLKILDAFSMAKAVVAHPISCEGIDAENGQNVIFAETAQEYVSAIARLTADSSQCSAISKKARLLVELRYSYDTIGRRLSDLFRGLAPKAQT